MALTTAGTANSKDMTTETKEEEEYDGVQIRVSFHLAAEYQHVAPSLRVPHDVIAVPADIHRKGLSTIINHLLDRHDDDKDDDADDDMKDDDDDAAKLPTIPFEFMIGNSHQQKHGGSSSHNTVVGHRLLRSTGGIEREARQLGLSLEEAIPVTYFPAQLPPSTTTKAAPKLPDWIGTMECVHTNHATSSLLLCTGCYDGSIVVLSNATTTTRGTSAGRTNNHNQNDDDDNDTMDAPLSIVATKAVAHDGPIHCLSTTTTQPDQDILIVTGSMDHLLRIHPISQLRRPSPPQTDDDPNILYEFRDVVDCCINGHTTAISSVDSIMTTNSLLYIASGDYDGNVGLWEYNHSGSSSDMKPNESQENEQPSSSKKMKTTTKAASRNGTSDTTNPTMRKEIASKSIFRAHTSKVSGVAFGNYEKVQSSSSSSSFVPQQLITGSWDHSMKVWDIERQDNVSTINGQRVITCFDTSYHTSGIVVTGHPDCVIRLWDTRTTITSSSNGTADTTSLKVSDSTFKPSHKEWVSSVKWSPTNPYHIVSTSYDGTMKLWDIRTSLPLYTVRTFPAKEKGMTVCYSSGGNDNAKFLFAGGTDCIVKTYKLP